MEMSQIDLSKPPLIDEGGLLARLWRDIVEKNGMIHKLDNLVGEYVAESNRKGNVKRRKSKHTLITNICSEAMTWKVFLELLELSKFKSIEISVKVTDQRGNTSVHVLPITMSAIGGEGDDGKRTDD